MVLDQKQHSPLKQSEVLAKYNMLLLKPREIKESLTSQGKKVKPYKSTEPVWSPTSFQWAGGTGGAEKGLNVMYEDMMMFLFFE